MWAFQLRGDRIVPLVGRVPAAVGKVYDSNVRRASIVARFLPSRAAPLRICLINIRISKGPGAVAVREFTSSRKCQDFLQPRRAQLEPALQPIEKPDARRAA
jgi:hypothetical protein